MDEKLLNELLFGEDEIRLYSKKYGFIKFRQLSKSLNIVTYNTPITYGSYGNNYGGYEETQRDDIFTCYRTVVIENGKQMTKFEYEKPIGYPLFVRGYQNQDKGKVFVCFAKKKNDSYYKIDLPNDNFYVQFQQYSTKTVCGIEAVKFIKNNEWEINPKLKLVDIQFVSEIKECESIFLTTNSNFFNPDEPMGECKITKKYPFMGENQKYFQLTTFDNKSIDVLYNDPRIKLLVPLDYKPVDEFAELHITVNELELNPFIKTMSNGFTIFWKKMENANLYIVNLYVKRDNCTSERTLYIMSREIVDRNQFYKTYTNLPGGEYYVKVCAEDRGGSKLAESYAFIVIVVDALQRRSYY